MWTNIPKPSGRNYTNVNSAKPSYDEPTLAYDDSSTYYDGFNNLAWTSVAKPSSNAWVNISKPT